jgi:hypothetical protein
VSDYLYVPVFAYLLGQKVYRLDGTEAIITHRELAPSGRYRYRLDNEPAWYYEHDILGGTYVTGQPTAD